MTNQQPKDEPKTLYQITGDVADINTVLINRGELSNLRADLERVNMQLVACGVVAMSDTPDSAKKARIMHPDYESSSLDDVKRRVDECIELRTRVAELEAQLESIGAGGIGPLISAPQPPTPSRPEIDHAHELRRHSRKLGQPVGETAGVMQRAADEIDRLRAALEQPVAGIPASVLAGWKLAPVEPSKEMCVAGATTAVKHDEPYFIYQSMLEAAPQPPAAQRGTAAPNARSSQVIDALTSYCNTGEIDGADDLLAELLFERDHPPAVERPNVDPCKDGSCDCCWTDKPQPQIKQEFESTTWSTVDGSRCLHCQEPLSKHIGQRCCPTKRQQPQGDQEPVAWIENVAGGVCYTVYHAAAMRLPDGVRFDLYASQQPRQPLTDEEIVQVLGNVREQLTGNVFLAFARSIESAHGIVEEPPCQ